MSLHGEEKKAIKMKEGILTAIVEYLIHTTFGDKNFSDNEVKLLKHFEDYPANIKPELLDMELRNVTNILMECLRVELLECGEKK